MANLLLEQGSAELPIGSIISAAGPPDSNWHLCDGSILEKSNYPSYVANCEDLHPGRWSHFEGYDIGNPNAYIRYGISNINDYVVIVGVNNLVNYSDDGGLTWSTSTLNSANTHYTVANDGSTFVAAEYSAAYMEYSTDYGASWTRVACAGSTAWKWVVWNGTYFIVMKSTSGNVTISRSTDGTSWTAIDLTSTSQIPSATPYGLAVDASGNLLTYVYISGTGYRFYKSTNDGVTWSTDSEAENVLTDVIEDEQLYFFSYCNGRWYAFPYNNYWNWFVVSDDGLTGWKMVDFPKTKTNSDISVFQLLELNSEVVFILGSTSYECAIMISSDGLHDWIRHVNPYYTSGTLGNTVASNGDWMIVLNYTSYMRDIVGRCVYINYDDTTYFQLPAMNQVTEPGNYKYIKLA